MFYLAHYRFLNVFLSEDFRKIIQEGKKNKGKELYATRTQPQVLLSMNSAVLPFD